MNVVVRRILTEPFRPRTWRETAYAIVGLPIGVAGTAFIAATLYASGLLLVTFIGLPLLAVTGLLARWLGDRLRRVANWGLDADVAPAQPFRHKPGFIGWLTACLKDGTAWRARLYLVCKLPLGVLGFGLATAFWVYGLGGLTYWAWRPLLPCETSTDHTCHRGVGLGGHMLLDTPVRLVLTAIAGAILVLAAPWVVRAALRLDLLFVRIMLGPSDRDERVVELERTRAVAVDDSAATLRRIERDLHDGTQARLVALAMSVGLAREKLAEGNDPAGATHLLDQAHASAKQAIVELRDLARGIHPPVLDAGLDAALVSLAAHSSVPVEVDVSLSERPNPALETMLYFCAAELITNIAKHSGAAHGSVRVHNRAGGLQLIVSDDGRGGAHLGTGTGLTGLAERVATVDGELVVTSPAGGPTTVAIDVPARIPATR